MPHATYIHATKCSLRNAPKTNTILCVERKIMTKKQCFFKPNINLKYK